MSQPAWISALAELNEGSLRWDVIAGADGSLVRGIRHAVLNNAANDLFQAQVLLSDPRFATNAANEAQRQARASKSSPVDQQRINAFARAWISTAQAARILWLNQQNPEEVKRSLVSAAQEAVRSGAATSMSVEGVLCKAREELGDYAGWQTVLCWTAGWTQSRAASRSVTVPIAALTTNGAVILHLSFETVNPQIDTFEAVVRYDCALDLIDDQTLRILKRCADSARIPVEWCFQRSKSVQSHLLWGDSLGGAAAAGVHLLAAGRDCSPECVILATVRDDTSLGSVGGLIPKLEAALNAGLKVAVIAPQLEHDLSRFSARGLAVLARKMVTDAAEAADAINSAAARERFSLELSRRSFVFSPLPSDRVAEVHTVHGPVAFNADDLGTYTHVVHFSSENRCRDVFELAYRTESEDCRFEASTFPSTVPIDGDEKKIRRCNQWEESPDFGNFRRDKRFFKFLFDPLPDQTYTLTTHIYRGFKRGRRHVHCHVPSKARISTVEFELDLTRYLDPSGWDVVLQEEAQPYFYWQEFKRPEDDPGGECEMHKERLRVLPPEAPVYLQNGYWFWRFHDVQGGAWALIDWEHVLVPNGRT
jgi:hypothetical protein